MEPHFPSNNKQFPGHIFYSFRILSIELTVEKTPVGYVCDLGYVCHIGVVCDVGYVCDMGCVVTLLTSQIGYVCDIDYVWHGLLLKLVVRVTLVTCVTW